ncbi:MAG: metallophosphoesterase [Acutalibacteraceae bacterium]|nr:metallophosphoesterase [Acutalibacteraceae bacterium]
MSEKLKISLFADFHYKKGMYSITLYDLLTILKRAEDEKAEIILHAGDFCNDYVNSKEVIEPLLNNKMGINVYGVYGNHELESYNSMNDVTKFLTNDQNVVWGTKDGKIGDGSIAYYYADIKNFRIVCTDTNYSFNSEGFWEHNRARSFGPPNENTFGNSLGTEQLIWLEKTLIQSAKDGKKCIIISHDSFSGKFRSTSPDSVFIRNLFSRVNAMKKGTVLMAINGHIHTNNACVLDNVLYLDMNTAKNSWWQGIQSEHYTEEQTYKYSDFDENGNVTSTYDRSYTEDWMNKNTWYSADPLSAIVTITDDGEITVEGMESDYVHGVLPPETKWNDCEPRVLSGNWKLDI